MSGWELEHLFSLDSEWSYRVKGQRTEKKTTKFLFWTNEEEEAKVEKKFR